MRVRLRVKVQFGFRFGANLVDLALLAHRRRGEFGLGLGSELGLGLGLGLDLALLAHGFVLTLAAGGILTELLSDQVSLVLPVQVKDVNKALGQLKLSKLLAGYRGKPAAERSQIVKAVMALQEYVLAHINEVEEVEINPLIVTPARSIAVDALIRKGEADV